jgi:two-component system response regulator PilR (NtrC family)
MKEGAFDYVTKPFNVDELKLVLAKAFEQRAMRRENRDLKRMLKQSFTYGRIIGRSRPMRALYDLIERIKDTPVMVLITGESGTGKELVARAIHVEGARADQPFQSINCGAIPENLIESELFGYKKGAFTGAIRDFAGLFVAAQGGTLLLDEVGEMPLLTQVKLLRVLQERRVKPVGGLKETPIDVRIIAATNRDLAEEVRAGRFREDLYYRLRVVTLELPSLRERRTDIPLLAKHFLDRYCEEFGRPHVRLTEDAMQALTAYDWPGNVRELENAIQRGVALCRGQVIDSASLPREIVGDLTAPEGEGAERLPTRVGAEGLPLERVLEAYERILLEAAMGTAQGVKKDAAKLLGITFRSFRYRLQKLGLEDPDGTALS